MNQRQFQVVEDEVDQFGAKPVAPPEPSSAAVAMLMLSLKALSQRALIALADLFCLFTAFSVFWLFFLMPEDPSPQRIATLGIYAVFILLLNLIVRRK